MDPFVRMLVRRMHDPKRPLTRNKHFHAFDSPHGRQALRISRRLRSLQQDILATAQEGRATLVVRSAGPADLHRVELRLERVKGRRMAILDNDELELLTELPGVREVLPEVTERTCPG